MGQRVDPDHLKNMTPTQIEAVKVTCWEEYLACMLLRGADNIRYGPLKVELSNDMTKGTDNYPKTMVEATWLLNDYKIMIRPQHARDKAREGLAFIQECGAGRWSRL